MHKQVPQCPENKPNERKPAFETLNYSIQLLTPMFGGGAEAGAPDPITPFRPSEIRGQLQFWWRATRGAACLTSEELYKRQAEIWGSTERASPVRVEVVDFKAEESIRCAVYKPKPRQPGKPLRWRLDWNPSLNRSFDGIRPLPYALFPFQGKEPNEDREDAEPVKYPAKFVPAGSFRLSLHLSSPREGSLDLKMEVEAAVWAWLNFGGLGARTRRGCGALLCRELAPRDPRTVADWYADRRRTYGLPTPTVLRAWPTLPESILIRPEIEKVKIDAWCGPVALLQKFRQGKDLGRDSGSLNQPGRSRFPEPETIRNTTMFHGHPAQPNMPADAFPRAELGLPLIFHFKKTKDGEPPDTTLNPIYPNEDGKRMERMASPIILRPLGLENGNVVPMIVRLVAPIPAGLELDFTEKLDFAEKQRRDLAAKGTGRYATLPRGWNSESYAGGVGAIRDPRFKSVSPMSGSPNGSAIEAFLKLASGEGFK